MEPYNTIKDYLDNTPQDEVNKFIEHHLSGPPSWAQVKNNFQDLIDAQVENVLQWYLRHGWKEGRLIPRGFDLAPSTVIPSGWKPPTTPGWHEICSKTGPFFMGGCRTSTGLRIGTYRPAKWYEFDGTLKLMGEGSQESFYSFYKSLITTECPAGMWDGTTKRWEGTGVSLAFDVHEISGGLSLFTADSVGFKMITMMKSANNGQDWNPYATITPVNGKLIQCYSDGAQEFLIGYRDNCPYICDTKGNMVMKASDYKDQVINYGCYHKGVAVLGCNNIDPIISDGTRRNGYLNYWDGRNFISGMDLKAPYIMNIKQDPEKDYVYAVSSIWNETNYPNPELVRSKDGKKWEVLSSVPMPSCQTIEIADGGVYCYGGKFGEYGKVMFLKF